MEPPKRCEPYKNAQSNRQCFCPVAALCFQYIFFQKAFKSFPAEVAVENFLALEGIFNEIFHLLVVSKFNFIFVTI